jgi:hypothetical protein
MSRRGASSRGPESDSFDFVPTPALAQPVLRVAKELQALGLTSAEVCSLFSHAAAMLAHQDDGLPRGEFLELVTELYDADAIETNRAITSPGGSA